MCSSDLERPTTQLIGDFGAALQQPAVEVEHIAGIRLTAGRAAQQQRNRPVGDRLLRRSEERRGGKEGCGGGWGGGGWGGGGGGGGDGGLR